MIAAVAAQSVGFVLLLIGVLMVWRSRGSTPKATLPVLVAALVCTGIGTGLLAAILIQEKTGVVLGVSGGIGSDARAWVRNHEIEPPKKGDVGQNMKVLNDGVAFLKAHQAELPVGAKATLEELSRVPPKPTKILTVSEEAQYYRAAETAFTTIRELTQTGSQPN